MRVSLLNKTKPNSCTESSAVNMAGIRGKERVSTRGGLTSGVGGGKKTVIPATAVSGGESNHSNNES